MSDIAALTSTATALAGANNTQSESALSQLTEDLDNFLTILTTQLQHQDPLEPLDTHEFTQQLVQFSSVEQLIAQNKNLESIIELQQNAMAISAVSYMGKQISATGQENMLGEGQSTFSYTLPQNAAAASATITNEAGSTVYYGAAETTSGKHSFVWDGSSTTGVAQPDGKYQLTINATNPDGQPITPSYGITGSVTGVEFDGGTAVLSIGSVKVPLTNVTQIHDTE